MLAHLFLTDELMARKTQTGRGQVTVCDKTHRDRDSVRSFRVVLTPSQPSKSTMYLLVSSTAASCQGDQLSRMCVSMSVGLHPVIAIQIHALALYL
jgi:hypothetical protein